VGRLQMGDSKFFLMLVGRLKMLSSLLAVDTRRFKTCRFAMSPSPKCP
jgi:hypothetical protein